MDIYSEQKEYVKDINDIRLHNGIFMQTQEKPHRKMKTVIRHSRKKQIIAFKAILTGCLFVFAKKA